VMLLAALLANFRPRWLAVPAVLAAFAANVAPYTATAIARTDRAANVSFWRPFFAYVTAHLSSNYRLEVVPTVNHWEAYYFPRSGFPIARGWYAQLDRGDNPILYLRTLTGAEYRAWLRSVGVRYVILAHTPIASEGAQERRLLLSGRSGLRRVFTAPSGRIYELGHPAPILTGRAPGGISSDTHGGISGWVSGAGEYLLRLHYTPYWTLKAGVLCVRRAPDDMTELEVEAPGRFSLRAPAAESALTIVFDGDARRGVACRGGHADRPRIARVSRRASRS
jgi:hypothetical protein